MTIEKGERKMEKNYDPKLYFMGINKDGSMIFQELFSSIIFLMVKKDGKKNIQLEIDSKYPTKRVVSMICSLLNSQFLIHPKELTIFYHGNLYQVQNGIISRNSIFSYIDKLFHQQPISYQTIDTKVIPKKSDTSFILDYKFGEFFFEGKQNYPLFFIQSLVNGNMTIQLMNIYHISEVENFVIEIFSPHSNLYGLCSISFFFDNIFLTITEKNCKNVISLYNRAQQFIS